MAALSPAAIESLAGEILASASLGPHAVFSLRPDAGREEFKARYRELARALHPDKAKSRAAEEAFKVVTESFRAVAAGDDAGGGGWGGGCPPPRANDSTSRDSTSRAPFWRVRGEDAAAAPPRWSAGAGAGEAEKTRGARRGGEPAAPRWSAAANGSARARAFEKQPERYSGGRRPSDANDTNANGERRKASPSPETVELCDDAEMDEMDPSQPMCGPSAWFDLDRREDASGSGSASRVAAETKKTHAATARWNDSPRIVGWVFFPSAAPSARMKEAPTDPFPYSETLEEDPEPRSDAFFAREDEDDSSFGGEKVWRRSREPPTTERTGGGWGDGAAARSAGRSDWRGGGRFAEPKRRAPIAPPRAAPDFRGFDVADVGDPSELERLACEGNEENDPVRGVAGFRERAGGDAARAARKDEDDAARASDAAENDATRTGKAGKKKPKPARAVSRKRGRSKKAAEPVPAAPRPRLAALDEPRIPHTKLPRKKFAQATLAFS